MSNERVTDYEGNLVEEIIDNGDGTGTKIVYDLAGGQSSEDIELPIVQEPELSPEEQLEQLRVRVEELSELIESQTNT